MMLLKSLSEDKMKVKIPKHWTPEQANAVLEFMGDIEIAIRKKYQIKIMAHELFELNRKESFEYREKNGEDNDF